MNEIRTVDTCQWPGPSSIALSPDSLTHHALWLLLRLTHLLSELLLLLHLLLHRHLLVLMHGVHHGPALATVSSDPHRSGAGSPSSAIPRRRRIIGILRHIRLISIRSSHATKW